MAKKKGATDGAPADKEPVKIPEDRETPRLQAENALLAEHKARRAQERNDAPPAEDPPADPAPSEPPPELAPSDPAPEPEYEILKVDGAEVKFEKSKVYEEGRRALQKESAADKRLRDAADKVRQADELLEQARQKAEALAKPEKPDIPLDKEELSKLAHTIRYGTDEESVEALARLTSAGAKATGYQTKDLESLVDQRVQQVSDRQRFESALERVKLPPDQGGFGDLFDGGILENAFAFQDAQLAKDEPTLNYEARLKKAGEKVRETFHLTPTTPPENGSRNAQRKAQVSRTVTAASPAVNIDPQPPKTERQRFNEQLAKTQNTRKPI